MYYFLLLAAYAVVTVLTAKPIWAFLGIPLKERSYDPAVIGDFSYIKVALITFIIVSILIGVMSRINYSYYRDKSFDGKMLPKLKGKLIRRYLVVMIASFAIALLAETTTEQGYLADIKAGFGLWKAAAFLAAMLLVGLFLCLGTLLFVRKEKAAVFEKYGDNALISGHGKNYRNLTDEELFPALMKKPLSERLKGQLAADYKSAVLALGDKHLSDYRMQKTLFKPEEYENYKNLCRSAGHTYCWGPANEWLNEMLKEPDKVDSFPDANIDLGTAWMKCIFSSPNAAATAKHAAQKRAVEDAMRQWNEDRDARERMFNAALSGDLRTEEEQYLGGDLSESTYMEGRFQRDVDEDEARRKIESQIYSDDDDLFDITQFDDNIPLSMNYFNSLGRYINMVKEDWNEQETRSTEFGIPRFYQMLWPVYVAGHSKNAKDYKTFKSGRRGLFISGCLVILAFVIKLITDVTSGWAAEATGWKALMVFVNPLLVLIFLGIVIAALISLFVAVSDLKKGISGLKESNIKDVRKQAASCAPALYLQLRFYKLWKKDDPAVRELETILNRYYEMDI